MIWWLWLNFKAGKVDSGLILPYDFKVIKIRNFKIYRHFVVIKAKIWPNKSHKPRK